MGPLFRSGRLRRRAASATCAGVVVLALAVGSGAPATAAGDPDATKKAKVDRGIAATKQHLDDTSSALVKANADLADTGTRLVSAQADSDAAQAALATAQARNAEAVARLEVATADEAKAKARLKQIAAQIDGARKDVASFAARMYQEQGASQLTIALQAESPGDFADRLEMVGTVMSVQRQVVDHLATQRAGQVAEEAHLAAVQDERAAAQAQAQASLAAAAQAHAAATAAEAALATLQQQQQDQHATLTRRKSEEAAKLRAMQAESARLAAILKARAEAARRAAEKARKKRGGGSSGGGASSGGGGFLSAAELGQPITSEFGMRFHPILHIWRLHTGLDFGGPCGTPIYAAGPGSIIQAGSAGGYGNRIVIDHGLVQGVDLASTYNHLQRIVRWGGHVSRGDLIGYEGTTGLSTGCHLHFETLENGSFVNPRKWL